ncbi:MAG: glycerophosphodiester phosphodiesterase [Bacillota bacterium]|jgi:hypothetical protein|nr:glycerophosphodiester phosphodiesterase [Bacillota bacterium]HHU42775.1 glycerophosphodiester phosphodiesterase [Clostridiales bacterium]
MLITAHGGALGTGRNSQKFFDTIKDYEVDVIEVDVQRRKERLYISHASRLCAKKALSLEYVFEYIKEHDFMVNCDMKRKGLVKDVLELGEKKDVSERIIFTGNVSLKDLDYLKAGQVYLNGVFFLPLLPLSKNLQKIKERIERLNNPRIKGINIPYRFCSDEMLKEALRIGLPISAYTVDNPAVIERLKNNAAIANITTNNITAITKTKSKSK